MEIRNLQTFVMAASLLNFTQTARELGYSQSNISMQIQQLEEEVGARLFDRIGKSISLTHQGQELLPYAQEIVSLAGRMESALKPDEELGGTIRIGMCQSVFEAVFEPVFQIFHKRFPKVRVDVAVDGTTDLLMQLQKNLIDTACLVDRPLTSQIWRCLYEKPARIGVVMNPRHRLAGKELLTVSDLEEETFVLMEEDAPYNLMLYPMFSSSGIEDRIKLRLENCDMAARLIADCDSVTLLPEYAVRSMVQEGRVRFIPLQNYEQRMSVQMVTHRNKVLTPQILGFSEAFALAAEN